MLLRSRSTGGYVFYPRVAEPRTGATDLEWVEASGRGSIYACTIVRQRPPTPNYNVVLVDLAEGPRMMSTVVEMENEDIRIGMPVQAAIIERDGAPLVVFKPANI
ncbi:Zn-ribbon domain-containing OB-fold protein [Xanthobacter aminoxidans]